jgi:hypothetical protein
MFISKNIRYFINLLGIGQERFGSLFGLTRGKVVTYIANTVPPVEVCLDIADYFRITVETLVRKDIENEKELTRFLNTNFSPAAHKGEPERLKLQPVSSGSIPMVTVDEVGSDNIVMVDTKAAAGYPIKIQEPEYFKALPAFKIPHSKFKNATFRCFQIEGRSMLELKAGEWVIGRYASNGVNDITDNQIYVVVTRNALLVKRVISQINESRTIRLISTNKEYKDQELSIDEVQELWSFAGAIKFDLDANESDLMNVVLDIQQRMIELQKK